MKSRPCRSRGLRRGWSIGISFDREIFEEAQREFLSPPRCAKSHRPVMCCAYHSDLGLWVDWLLQAHKLCHTYATNLLNVGPERVGIQALLDHESSATTSIDTHANQDRMVAMVNKLQGFPS